MPVALALGTEYLMLKYGKSEVDVTHGFHDQLVEQHQQIHNAFFRGQ